MQIPNVPLFYALIINRRVNIFLQNVWNKPNFPPMRHIASSASWQHAVLPDARDEACGILGLYRMDAQLVRREEFCSLGCWSAVTKVGTVHSQIHLLSNMELWLESWCMFLGALFISLCGRSQSLHYFMHLSLDYIFSLRHSSRLGSFLSMHHCLKRAFRLMSRMSFPPPELGKQY